MRALILSLMATFWLTAGSVQARNGETGILIVIRKFEVQLDESNRQVIVICEDDWKRVQSVLDEGYEPHVYFAGIGVYLVEEEDDGTLRIHKAEEEENITMKFHACPVHDPSQC